jgi:hypothetical protein
MTMRILLTIAFCLFIAPAWALDCSTVENPGNRLICYDTKEKAAKHPPPTMRFDIPVSTRKTMPDFDGRDKAFKDYRTRIRSAVERGPNFAGHMSLLQIGCGTGCTFVLAIDLNTGKVYGDFPFGGEETLQLKLDFQRTGNMVLARYLSQGSKRCLSTTLTWDGKTFSKMDEEAELGGSAFCDTKVTF